MANPVAIESSNFALWAGKQVGRGTPVATADKFLRQVDGNVDIERTFGNENYGDGQRYSNAQDFTNTVVGGGDVGFQGQPGPASWMLAQHLGTDSIGAPVSTVYPHTITPANAGGRWLTVWKKVGSAVGPHRVKYNDTRIAQLQVSCSQGAKVLRMTPTLLSIDPGEVFTSDPVKADDDASNVTDQPFLWTEATGLWNFDGGGAGAVGEVDEVNVTMNDNLDAWYGDDVKPALVVPGRGVVTVSFAYALTDLTLPVYNKVHYGSASPAGGAKPVKTIFSGSLDVTMTRGATTTLRSLRLEVPKINYAASLAIAGNADGGVVKLPMAGEARILTGSPIIRWTGNTLDSVAY